MIANLVKPNAPVARGELFIFMKISYGNFSGIKKICFTYIFAKIPFEAVN